MAPGGHALLEMEEALRIAVLSQRSVFAMVSDDKFLDLKRKADRMFTIKIHRRGCFQINGAFHSAERAWLRAAFATCNLRLHFSCSRRKHKRYF